MGKESEKAVMRLYLNESDRTGHRSLQEAVTELLRHEGAAGVSVFRGIAGFGVHRTYHTDRLLDLSSDLPLIIEVIDDEERINHLLPLLETLMSGGMITIGKVTARFPGKPTDAQ